MEEDLSAIMETESLEITVVNTEYKPLHKFREEEMPFIRLTPDGRQVTIEKKMGQEIASGQEISSDWGTLVL